MENASKSCENCVWGRLGGMFARKLRTDREHPFGEPAFLATFWAKNGGPEGRFWSHLKSENC